MTKRTLLEIYLPFVVLFVFILPVTTTISAHSNTNIQTLAGNSFKIIDLINAPITIIGNAQFVNWSSSGDGSSGNPYIIANYNISCTTSTDGVSIQNTTKYFVLRNINVSNCANGFYLNHVMFGTITKSFATNNGDGFALTGSSTNNILLNDVADNNYNNGFSLDTLSSNNSLINNVATQSIVAGFSLNDASNNILSNNTTMQNENSAYIIYYYGGNGYGFWIVNSSDNMFMNNLASGNNEDGFYLASSSNNVLLHNVANNNTGDGFHLTTYNYSSSSNNTLSFNTASRNNNGFLISASNSNTLVNNTATQNDKTGFYIGYASSNTLQNNLATNNTDGFSLYYSDNNTLLNNIGHNNAQYDYYNVDSANTIFTNNSFGISTTANTNTIPASSDNTTIYGTVLVVLGMTILVGMGLVAFVYFKRKTINTSSDIIKKHSEYDTSYHDQPNRSSNVTICPVCGLEALSDDQYCVNCGTKLKT